MRDSEVKPPTGEPYPGDPAVRFGGRGSRATGPPYLYRGAAYEVALDLEPVDAWAGGYTWTAVDGSLAVAAVNAWHVERTPDSGSPLLTLDSPATY